MSRHRVILDTDPGIDDAMALLFAAFDPAIDLVGVTSVFGNVDIEVATRNALRLVEMTGLAVPVAAGAGVPLVQAPLPHPAFVHGVEGFGDIPRAEPQGRPDPRPADQFLVERTAAEPGLTLVAVGPLTNLALALRRDPDIARRVAQVVVMGGVVDGPGNVTPHAEANIWQDPHAAAEVFAAPWPVTLVGLDVTQTVRCTPGDFAAIAHAAPVVGGFLARAARHYMSFHDERAGFHGCFMHDPTAMVALTDPRAFAGRRMPLRVTLAGVEAGRTQAGGDGPPVAVLTWADVTLVRDRFLQTIARADGVRATRTAAGPTARRTSP